MANDGWFRNYEWDEQVESLFFAMLRRARRKAQYLRIQGSILASRYPDVALSLLDQYFQLSDDFDDAQAYCDMAKAHLAKDDVPKALTYYDKALRREAEFPNLKTQAYLEYAMTVVSHQVEGLYQSALDVLDAHTDRLLFVVDRFQWHAVKAIIARRRGDKSLASDHAKAALETAQIKTSGFVFHKNVGLVGEEHKGLIKQLRALL